jgi:hypothetical protein
VYFFEVADFGESYSRTPGEERLSRERLLEILAAGSDEESGVPFLGVRATERGRESHFASHPEDREPWSKWQRNREKHGN